MPSIDPKLCDFGHQNLQLRGPEPGGEERDGVRALLRQGHGVAVRPAVPGQRDQLDQSGFATLTRHLLSKARE